MSIETMAAIVRHLKAKAPHAVQALQAALAGLTRGGGLLDLEPPQAVLDEAMKAVLLAAMMPGDFNPAT